MKSNSFATTSPDEDRTPGAKVCGTSVHFGYFAASSRTPSLLLYKKGSREPVVPPIPFPESARSGNFYSMRVCLPRAEEYEYNFLDGEKIVTDPYAALLAGREKDSGFPEIDPHGLRGRFLTGSYRWGNEHFPDIPWQDAVLYSLHVRGFTMDAHSGVSKKGTFAGLKGKIPYLNSLGVNQLLLMPVYEFSEIDLPDLSAAHLPLDWAETELGDLKVNYWGYGPGFYFAPKASYADSDRSDLELKDLVRALHANGIEILLEFSFTGQTDIGLICRCLQYWTDEYHIDGFSILGRDDLFDELARLPLFRDRKLICRYFSDAYKKENSGNAPHQIAQCNEGFMNDCRRTLKGDPGSIDAFNYRIREHPEGCAQINYITNHDGFTLTDLVSYNMKHNEENGEMGCDGTDDNLSWNCGEEGPSKKKSVQRLRMQQRKNAYAMLLLSQGTPMLLSGDEFGNSQNGNNNAWCQDNACGWLSWSRTNSAAELKDYVRSLIAYRKKHPVLHLAHEPQCQDSLALGYPDLSYHSDRAWVGENRYCTMYTGILYNGAYAGEDCFLYIAWNFYWKANLFALPILPKKYAWYRVMDTSLKKSFLPEAQKETIDTSNTFLVSPRAVVILEGRKENETKKSTSNN